MSGSQACQRVVALCGGIGGAKLALGLHRLLGDALTVIVNTGDDFEHLGLHISPDIDTVLYTLGGVSDLGRGWGRADESWHFMEALRGLGGEAWFNLGDRDLATHVERTRRLRAGETLTAVTATLAERLGIAAAILPMSDDPVRTTVETDRGVLAFQRYFVEHRCEPRLRRLVFAGADAAKPSPAVLAALADPRCAAIVICPSNPFLSVDPILAVPGLRAALASAPAPVVAVSPIIGGAAVKGPTAKIMAELGIAANSASIAAHYRGLVDGLVIDTADAGDAAGLDLAVHVAPTLMVDIDDRVALAQAALDFAARLATAPRRWAKA